MKPVYVYLLLILVAAPGCMTESRRVEERFEEALLYSGVAFDPVAIYGMLDAESREYLEAMVNARTTTQGVAQVGHEHGLPMVSMLIGALSEELQVEGYSNIADSPAELLTIIGTHGMGIFRHNLKHPIRLQQPPSVSGNTAYVSVLVAIHPDNPGKIASTYRFVREDERWQLNLLSTLTLMEKLLRQQFEASGLPPDAFFRDLAHDPGREFMLRARY